jgi:hypothetical protein
MTITCNKCEGVARLFRASYKASPELGEQKIRDFLVRKQRKDNCAEGVQCLPELQVRKDPSWSIADEYWALQDKNLLGS